MIDMGGNVFRITVSPEVAFNPDAFGGLIAEIVGKLGCYNCGSGTDCLYQLNRNYFIDPSKKVLPQDPIPLRRDAQTVNIVMPEDMSHNIEALKQVAKVAFGKLGCMPCTSAYDVLFRNEIRTLAFDQKFNVQEFGRLR